MLSRDPDLRDCTIGGATTDFVRNVTDLQFEYYHGRAWRNEWESADGNFITGTRAPFTTLYTGDGQNNLPEAVRITITVQDELRREVAQTFSTIVYLPTSR